MYNLNRSETTAVYLISPLVNVASRVVEHSQHGHEAVTDPVGARNVGAGGADAVNVDTDSPRRLGDEGTLLERVVDTLNAVVLHSQQKATEVRKHHQRKFFIIIYTTFNQRTRKY